MVFYLLFPSNVYLLLNHLTRAYLNVTEGEALSEDFE